MCIIKATMIYCLELAKILVLAGTGLALYGSPLLSQIALTAKSYGLDTCWIGYLDVVKASAILGLPADMACLFLMPLGYAAEEPKRRTSRKPIEDLVFYNTWKNS